VCKNDSIFKNRQNLILRCMHSWSLPWKRLCFVNNSSRPSQYLLTVYTVQHKRSPCIQHVKPICYTACVDIGSQSVLLVFPQVNFPDVEKVEWINKVLNSVQKHNVHVTAAALCPRGHCHSVYVFKFSAWR